ncbi:MAG: hypothetical protein Q8N79_04275 [Candidatus Methanoperedens sp.]|nr:hypothetical protein [Candidatus Methanoperedens sp.]
MNPKKMELRHIGECAKIIFGQGWEVVEKYISTQNCSSGEKAL